MGGGPEGREERKKERKKGREKKEDERQSHGNSRAAFAESAGQVPSRSVPKKQANFWMDGTSTSHHPPCCFPPPTTHSRRDDVPVSQSLGKSVLVAHVGSISILHTVEWVADC